MYCHLIVSLHHHHPIQCFSALQWFRSSLFSCRRIYIWNWINSLAELCVCVCVCAYAPIMVRIAAYFWYWIIISPLEHAENTFTFIHSFIHSHFPFIASLILYRKESVERLLSLDEMYWAESDIEKDDATLMTLAIVYLTITIITITRPFCCNIQTRMRADIWIRHIQSIILFLLLVLSGNSIERVGSFHRRHFVDIFQWPPK